ncbi:S9 family peptidase [Psychromicrobium xiongbiense]|uniref:S9 family peptidase n=1 Tax=Psychromicrobium xiongbiense TaxID=3051184 RepID=UPI002552349A|nr:S9 family peptidase [Psychromicrobium sp. YIM S02556]
MTIPAAATPSTPPTPAAQAPRAAKVPQLREHHGDTFVDSYEWLRDKDSPEVLAHLTAEQAYTDDVTAGQEPLREAIFQEIKGRTQETDLSVPYRRDDWWYYVRMVEGQQYAIHCRVPAQNTGDLTADWTPPVVIAGQPVPGEEILLDGNVEAEGQPFFALGGQALTRDHRLLAYAVDNAGDERFTLHIKDLSTGELLPDTVENIFYGLAFSPDGTELFYTVVDDSWRPYQVKSHRLGTDPAEDLVLFQEDDPGLWTGFELSSDRNTLLVSVGCSEYSETRLLDFADRAAGLQMVIPRSERVLYDVDPVTVAERAQLMITHNRAAQNSMVSLVDRAELSKPLAEQQWLTVLAHRDTVRVNGTASTKHHAFISVRQDTTEKVLVLPLAVLESGTPDSEAFLRPEFEEELSTVELAWTEYRAPLIRLSYTSFVTPPRLYDYVLASGELVLRKETPVLGGYDPADYVAEREWATASDGTRIPLSVIRRADLARDASHPAVIYGYGSYEASMDPGFAVPRLSLLDRGIVFVIAHIRGGGELGRAWYEDGKKLTKKNTFTDFVAATDWLATSGWADPQRIAAMGGSAGGLLMGAVLNLAPEKYAAVLAQVPFVDALTSILDPELPLSALEWEEWGNPITDAEVYQYMKEYSPYENVRSVAYPKIAAVTSLNDTRVLYVEPAKWVQVLREVTTGSEPIVLKIELDGGHGGASGRYEGWKTRAWDYAFLADALGATELVTG